MNTENLIRRARSIACDRDDKFVIECLIDALERLTQPVGVEPVAVEVDSRLCLRVDYMQMIEGWKGDHFDTGRAIPLNWLPILYSAETVARLIAERDDAWDHYRRAMEAGSEIIKERDTLKEQVKLLRSSLEKIADWDASWGPYPENNEAWRAMVVVTAREAVPRALSAPSRREIEMERDPFDIELDQLRAENELLTVGDIGKWRTGYRKQLNDLLLTQDALKAELAEVREAAEKYCIDSYELAELKAQEPVAWMWANGIGISFDVTKPNRDLFVPLFTAPQPAAVSDANRYLNTNAHLESKLSMVVAFAYSLQPRQEYYGRELKDELLKLAAQEAPQASAQAKESK